MLPTISIANNKQLILPKYVAISGLNHEKTFHFVPKNTTPSDEILSKYHLNELSLTTLMLFLKDIIATKAILSLTFPSCGTQKI